MDQEHCGQRKIHRRGRNAHKSRSISRRLRSRSSHSRSRSRSQENYRESVKYREDRMRSPPKKASRHEKCKKEDMRADSMETDLHSGHSLNKRDWERRDHNEKVREIIDKDKLNIMVTEYGFDSKLDKDTLEKKLEMQKKRRERLEKWKAANCKAEAETKVEFSTELTERALQDRKQWSTMDCDEDEDKKAGQLGKSNKILPNKTEINYESNTIQDINSATTLLCKQGCEENEEDPLDVFMAGVQEEIIKINQDESQTADKIIREIIEQDIDGLEYSSEEENDDFETVVNMNCNNTGKKNLAKIDHNAIEYSPFRKNFYIEVPELARMSRELVASYRCELEGIRVKGKGCPKPIKTWAHAGVSKREMEVLKKLGFEKPTPVQCQTIPAIMSGRDLIGIAKTGSGKTLAFLLPMFRHILDQPQLEDGDGPISILMTPTRELCMQIGKDAKRFCKYLNLRVACVYGGTGVSEQIAELKRGAEIVVCTPGRMIDMLAANSGRVTNLRRCTYIVLDEADRMFDMGFEPQVMRIVDNIRPDRQTVMFSATFPRQMEALARRILNMPIEIQVGGRSAVCKEVEQHVLVLEEEMKFFKLLELLGIYQEQGSVIVFVDKQENADLLLKNLMKARYSCLSLHGGIDQHDRDSNITDFKSGKSKLLVATSVAARGLDIKHLILVVNYDCPNHYEDYVHRCGRTGRAGNKGFAYTFVTPEQNKYSGDIKKALELSGTKVPEELAQLYDLHRPKQESKGKKVKSGGGFRGKGYKFDDAEVQLVNEKKKFQKNALGLHGSDDEDIEENMEQLIEKMIAPNTVTEITQIGFTDRTSIETAKNVSHIMTKENLTRRTEAISVMTAEAALKEDIMTLKSCITAKKVAEQVAAKLNRKLNHQPPATRMGTPNFDPIPASIKWANPTVHQKYQEELEINDFPQQARWRIISKGSLAEIADYSEADIRVRGTYVAPGKKASGGERKLHLVIQSISESAVSKAKNEIRRILKEEMLNIQTSFHLMRGSNRRYKVL